MNEKDIKRLVRSDVKLIQYCMQRILSDEESAKILKKIHKELEDEIKSRES